MGKWKIFILIVVTLVYIPLYSQYSNTLWYSEWRKLDFNFANPQYSKSSIGSDGDAGQFVLTDCNGKLKLLAGARSTIFNSLENRMKGAVDFDAIQSATIEGFIYPGTRDSIVIFHDYFVGSKPNFGYSIIDLSKDSGRGEVVATKINVLQRFNPNLCIIQHANKKDYWIIGSKDSLTAYSYLFTSSGLNSTPIWSSGFFNNYFDASAGNLSYGYAAIAPFIPTYDGKQIVVTGVNINIHSTSAALIYNFNTSTGKISNAKSLIKHSDLPNNDYVSQKAAISPNDTFIYFGVMPNRMHSLGDKGFLYQINRFTGVKKIINSQTYSNINLDGDVGYWATTLAPDGKIYIIIHRLTTIGGLMKLYRINQPNLPGLACKYRFWNFDSGSSFRWTFPTSMDRIQRPYFTANTQINSCADTTVFVYGGDTSLHKLVMRFGDGDTLQYSGPFYAGLRLFHHYKMDGTYPVSMITWDKNCNIPKWFTDTFLVYKPPQNFGAIVSHSPTCFGDTVKVTLNAQNHKMFTANWGYPKPGGGVYDTLIYTSSNSVSFRFFYPESSVKYSVTFSASNDFCGSRSSDSLTVAVYPRPQNLISLKQDSSCADRILMVSDSGYVWRNTSISWFGTIDSIVGTGNLQKGMIIPNSVLERDENIFLKSVNAEGCEFLDTLDVHVFPRPQGSLSSMDTIICALQQVFRASMDKFVDPIGTTWQLADGFETRNDTFWAKTYTLPGTFTLLMSGITNAGCTDSTYLNFRIIPLPKAGFKTNGDTICSRIGQLLLTSTAKSAGDPISEQWYTTGLGDTIFSNTAIIQYPSYGQYLIKQFIGTAQGCFDTLNKAITVYPRPDASFHLTDSVICSGQALLAISDSTKPWDFGDWYIPALGIKEPLNWGSGLPSVKLNGNQTAPLKGYYNIMYVLYNFEGCRDTVVRSVKVNNKPTANFVPPTICGGQESVFNSNSVVGDAPLSNVTWKIGTAILQGNVVKFTFSSIGNYPVTHIVQDTNNCADTISKMAIVKSTPKPKINWAPFRLHDGPVFSYSFTAEPQGMSEYQWTFDEAGIMSGMQVFPSFNSTKDSLKAELHITSGNGCKADTTIFFSIAGITGFYFPNAITMNNDGLNEGFGIAGPEFIKSYDLQIYNKWGERVFRTSDPYKHWIPEKPLPGLYVYYCKVIDVYNRPKEVKGTVLVIK